MENQMVHEVFEQDPNVSTTKLQEQEQDQNDFKVNDLLDNESIGDDHQNVA